MDRRKTTVVKGRGAGSNPAGRFDAQTSEYVDDGWGQDPFPDASARTELFPDKTRNIIARNQSPDVPFDRSINPYKGCEHGCVYCFARPTHRLLFTFIGRRSRFGQRRVKDVDELLNF